MNNLGSNNPAAPKKDLLNEDLLNEDLLNEDLLNEDLLEKDLPGENLPKKSSSDKDLSEGEKLSKAEARISLASMYEKNTSCMKLIQNIKALVPPRLIESGVAGIYRNEIDVQKLIMQPNKWDTATVYKLGIGDKVARVLVNSGRSGVPINKFYDVLNNLHDFDISKA